MTRLTIPEAAAELRCSQKTVRRMIGRGDLAAAYVAGRYLIPHQEITRVLDAPRRRTIPPPRPRPRKPGQPGSLTALVDAMDAA